MARATKVVGFSVPPSVAEQVAQIAREEHRTKSELFREMLRVYQRFRRQRDHDEERWVQELIQEAQDEHARHPRAVQEMLDEEAELARYGAEQARHLGITPQDIPRIIAASRKRHRV
jgi:metal-responsive CopG/Arc/MetJ family transcriptional regulator